MRLSIVQTQLFWENKAANLKMFDQKLAALAGRTDVVVLPEMFTTGFSMNAAVLAETMDGETMHWLANQAQKLNAVVTGSFICVENRRFFNRLVWMQPDSRYFFYDKRHRFGLAGEDEVYTAGQKRFTVEWKGLKICPLICYDLRFPIWSRNDAENPYDLAIYVANWPVKRVQHWLALLQARAIENQSWVVGVNIFGTDGNGFEYSGESAIFDYSGNQICRISGQEGIFTAEILGDGLVKYRANFPFLADRDDFRLL